MPKYVAFLRAINVGGHIVKMSELRAQFEALGFSNVETFIASGNVIFETRVTDTVKLEQKIEKQLLKALGYEVKTFLRTDAEVIRIAEYQAFHASDVKLAWRFWVGFLSRPMEKEESKTFMKFKTAIDDFHCNEREIYWLCKKKQSESDFSNNAFEKAVRLSTTFRGINTIQRLASRFKE
jgi:uncharacterized protein (DUF1697 family)